MKKNTQLQLRYWFTHNKIKKLTLIPTCAILQHELKKGVIFTLRTK
jgi:hypothetical protein